MPRIKASYLTTIILISVLVLVFSACKGDDSSFRKLSSPYFSMQYPAAWNLIPASFHYAINGPIEDHYVVNMKVDYNPSANMNLNLFREVVESQNNLTQLPGFVSVTEKEIEVNGVKALQRVIKTDIVLDDQHEVTLVVVLSYLVKNDQMGVVITAEVPENHYLSYKSTLDSMIHSFRFRS